MSWNITKAGPTAEVATEVRQAIEQIKKSSDAKSGELLEAIAQVIERVAAIKERSSWHTKLYVDTSGHVDSTSANGTLTFKSFA